MKKLLARLMIAVLLLSIIPVSSSINVLADEESGEAWTDGELENTDDDTDDEDGDDEEDGDDDDEEEVEDEFTVDITGTTSAYVTGTVTLKASVMNETLGEKVKNPDIKWESEDEKIAKVNSKGVITAVKKGEVEIYASYMLDGEEVESESILFTVKNPSATLMRAKKKVNGKTVSLKVGEKDTLSVKVSKAANKKVTYKPGNKKIATVSAKGEVKAVKAGTTKITAYVDGVSIGTVTYKVTKAAKKVTLTTPVIKASASSVKFNKKKTQSVTINVTKAKGKVTYANISDKKLKKYVSVNKKGKVVFKKAAPKGTYKIKVTVAKSTTNKAAKKTIFIKVK